MKRFHIEKEISKNRKKLNCQQLKNLVEFVRETFIITLKELIPYMFSFSVKEIKIKEIIKKYKDILEIENSIKDYLENIILFEQLKTKYFKYSKLDRNEILFLSASKYIKKTFYRSLFHRNKKFYMYIKRDIFDKIFKENNYNLELNIKYLGLYLSIDKVKETIR